MNLQNVFDDPKGRPPRVLGLWIAVGLAGLDLGRLEPLLEIGRLGGPCVTSLRGVHLCGVLCTLRQLPAFQPPALVGRLHSVLRDTVDVGLA